MVNYWKVKMNNSEKDYDISKKKSFIGIRWKGIEQDLSWIKALDNEKARYKIKKMLELTYSNENQINIGKWSGEIVNFVCLKKDNVVVTPSRDVKEVLIRKVVEEYTYTSYRNNWNDGCTCDHRISVELLKKLNMSNVSVPLRRSLNNQGTVTNLSPYKHEIELL